MHMTPGLGRICNLDACAQELRDSECGMSGFTKKVKALQILRELGQFDGKCYASDGCD